MIVKENSNVTVHYIGTLENGDEFDNSYKKGTPLSFTIGAGKVLKGFESPLVGKEMGDRVEISLSAKDAYGEINENAISEVERDKIPDNVKMEVGGFIRGKTQSGHDLIAKVLEIKENSYILDLNHPLAGKDLKFNIEILEVN